MLLQYFLYEIKSFVDKAKGYNYSKLISPQNPTNCPTIIYNYD